MSNNIDKLATIVEEMKANKVFQKAWKEDAENPDDIVAEVNAYSFFLVGIAQGMREATLIFKGE